MQELTDAAKPETPKNFIHDILSDDNGISFHRFQMFGWTIVLIFIFIAKVYNDLAMPDFDATLLTLMGISGGTYVGFKLPKQQGWRDFICAFGTRFEAGRLVVLGFAFNNWVSIVF